MVYKNIDYPLLFLAKGAVVEEVVVADLTQDNEEDNEDDNDSGSWESGDNVWDNDNSNAWESEAGNTDVDENFICTGQGNFASPSRCDVFYTCTSDGTVNNFHFEILTKH